MAAVTVLAAPLDRISADARVYPAYLLDGVETGLALFAAAYLGHNDSIHFARNDLVGTCVDTDRERLVQMSDLYPDDWRFYNEDAWDFAYQARIRGERWDVVSVDTFTGDATDRSVRTIELWCSLARKAVTMTLARGMDYQIPRGFAASLMPRSERADWLVLVRD